MSSISNKKSEGNDKIIDENKSLEEPTSVETNSLESNPLSKPDLRRLPRHVPPPHPSQQNFPHSMYRSGGHPFPPDPNWDYQPFLDSLIAAQEMYFHYPPMPTYAPQFHIHHGNYQPSSRSVSSTQNPADADQLPSDSSNPPQSPNADSYSTKSTSTKEIDHRRILIHLNLHGDSFLVLLTLLITCIHSPIILKSKMDARDPEQMMIQYPTTHSFPRIEIMRLALPLVLMARRIQVVIFKNHVSFLVCLLQHIPPSLQQEDIQSQDPIRLQLHFLILHNPTKRGLIKTIRQPLTPAYNIPNLIQ